MIMQSLLISLKSFVSGFVLDECASQAGCNVVRFAVESDPNAEQQRVFQEIIRPLALLQTFFSALRPSVGLRDINEEQILLSACFESRTALAFRG